MYRELGIGICDISDTRTHIHNHDSVVVFGIRPTLWFGFDLGEFEDNLELADYQHNEPSKVPDTVNYRKKEDPESKADRLLRRWLIRKVFGVFWNVVKLVIVMLVILFVLFGLGLGDFARFMIDSSLALGSAIEASVNASVRG